MSTPTEILEPLKEYESIYKDKFLENTKAYFEKLVDQSKTDEQLNKISCDNYYKQLNILNNTKDSYSKWNGGKIALIIFSFIFLLVGVVALMIFFLVCNASVATTSGLVSIIVAPISIVLGIVFIVLIVTVFNKKLKLLKGAIERNQKKADELLSICYSQTEALNNLFDWSIPTRLIRETTPLIDIDDTFSFSKFKFFQDKYGLEKLEDMSESITDLITGDIVGNPFVFQKRKVCQIINKTYQGSITVSVRRRDSKGNYYTSSEVLSASISKPAPDYYNKTFLVVGSVGAPDLSFSRKPSGINGKSDKAIEKLVETGSKKLDKLVRTTLTDDKPGEFTKLGNEEFDVLFGALDRDNEVQFRLMFTPLAQRNELALLKSDDTHFGDDFIFYKQKKLNYISSSHSQRFDYSGNPNIYKGFDLEKMREKFVTYLTNYFKGMFFDFAPILSIPLYQQVSPIEYIYKDEAYANFSEYEYEAVANCFKRENLVSQDSTTDFIVKSNLVTKKGKKDKIKLTAYSFRGEERVSYVTRSSSDGRTHQVPVRWVEYFKTERDTYMDLENPFSDDVTKPKRKDLADMIKDRIVNFTNMIKTDPGRVSVSVRHLLASLTDNYLED